MLLATVLGSIFGSSAYLCWLAEHLRKKRSRPETGWSVRELRGLRLEVARERADLDIHRRRRLRSAGLQIAGGPLGRLP